jgi:hypothetical protein
VGYFGDIAFASSIAKKLKLENQFEQVEYLIGYPQMETLMNNNPYIDRVYVSDFPNAVPSKNIDFSRYDKVIKLSQLSFEIPPAQEFQISAGVKNPDSEYEIYTNSQYDEIAKLAIEELKSNGKKVIAVMANWESKTYSFTESQYEAGIDVPNLGYGGKHRNINYIVSELEKLYNVIYVGYPQEYNQLVTSKIEDDNQKSILFECSIMKFCDAFIGTEGGLCNLAAGVKTKTIITGDFVHQLYGWNGVLKKLKNPKLGPVHYFLKSEHVELNPYISDEDILEQIKKHV